MVRFSADPISGLPWRPYKSEEEIDNECEACVRHFLSLSLDTTLTVPLPTDLLTAVAQKSPCEAMRVIMGKESPLKLSQRGPDARDEVPRRPPKRLDAEARIIDTLSC